MTTLHFNVDFEQAETKVLLNDLMVRLDCMDEPLEASLALHEHKDQIKTYRNSKHQNLLMATIDRGLPNAALFLVEFVDDLDFQDYDGNTALHMLVNHPSKESKTLIARIISLGANIALRNSYGHTPLTQAIYTFKPAWAETIIDASKDFKPNFHTYCGDSLLIGCCEKACSFLIERILKYDIDVNHKNKDGQTALMVAAEYDDAQIVKSLLAKSADKHARNFKKKTALDIAIENQSNSVYELLK